MSCDVLGFVLASHFSRALFEISEFLMWSLTVINFSLRILWAVHRGSVVHCYLSQLLHSEVGRLGTKVSLTIDYYLYSTVVW